MSITVFTSAPKALVRSIAMAAVLGSVVVGGEAAASINISATSATAFTSDINRFTSGDWLNGVWRREAGISVPNSTAARDAFKPGMQIRFADGQVRKITKVFVVGQHLSVYVDGPLLDGNKVGAPKKVSTVVASNTAPGASAPTPAPETAVGFTSQINRFTSSDWLNGVWRREAGISVPNSTAAREAFKPGVQVRFADGQVRKISKVYVVGQHLSVYVDGPLLDGSKVGAPNTVSTVTVSNTAPGTAAPAPTPTPNPAPAPDSAVGFTSQINRFTSNDFLNGVWRREAGVSIPATAGARDAFKPGVQVRLADGQVRKISKVFAVGSNISVYFEGSPLDGAKVGAPRTISTLVSASAPSTPAPAPQPKPQPQPDSKPESKPAPQAPSESTYSTGMNSFTNEDWDNGIYRKQAGFSIRNTSGNKAAFKQGASVRLADGQVRQVIAVYDIGEHLTVLLNGNKLSASEVGYPKTLTVVSGNTGSQPQTPAPAPTPTPTPAPSKPGSGNGIDLVGVNFASGVFDPGRVPGIYNQGYTYADESYYKRHSELGFKLIRLGFLWERIQPKLGTPLDAAELGRIKTSLDLAHKYGMKVVLDMHNYYRYYGKVINSPEVPRSAFTETWRKIAVEVHKHPALWGYGLMNEPYNTGNNLWPETALEASKAIRKVDPQTWIMVAGDRYSSALFWEQVNTKLISDPWMRDPKNNLVFEAHQYWDHDYSGSYRNRNETFAPMRGVDLVKPWVEWLKKHKLRGYLGEHGIPDFAPSGVVATDKMLAYLAENCIPSSYWAAGPRWGEDSMSLDVQSGKHRPQLSMLQKHAATKNNCSTIGPIQ